MNADATRWRGRGVNMSGTYIPNASTVGIGEYGC